MDVSAVRDALRSVPIFSSLDEPTLDGLMAEAEQRAFPPGHTILQQGAARALGFYLILEGGVEIRKGGRAVAMLGPGDYFGEMALLSEHDAPRSADVVTLDDTNCLVLTRDELRTLFSAHSDLAVKMLAQLAARLSGTDRALSE